MDIVRRRLSFSTRKSFSKHNSVEDVLYQDEQDFPAPMSPKPSSFVLHNGWIIDRDVLVPTLTFTCRSFPSEIIVKTEGIRKTNSKTCPIVRHGSGAEIVRYQLFVVRFNHVFSLILRENGKTKFDVLATANDENDTPRFIIDLLPKLNFIDIKTINVAMKTNDVNIKTDKSLPRYY